MSNSIVFLIFWVSGQTVPTARFVTSFDNMQECTAMVERINRTDKELKGHMTCMNVVQTIPNAGKAF